MSNLIGQTLGPYRIIEQIGIGGMATVYKAYQPSMDRYVAIKVLPAVLSRNPAFPKRFRREAKVVAKLEHKHILPVHDYGEQEALTYLVMRYVEAGTLKDRLAAGQLDLPAIYRLIAQVGSALDYAHRLGVIHRDVKPSNVLVDSQGDAYLTDFGLARIVESSEQLTATGVGVGTPDYMAPEQGQGLKIDHRSDVYSLGVTLYEMVTGQVPYQAETPIAIVLKHITAPLPLPRQIVPDLPEEVERVIFKAMAKKPEDRFQTVREMVEALDLAVRAATAVAPAVAQVEREVVPPVSAPPARKFRWPWDGRTTALGVGIAALALLVIGGMLFALSRIQYRVQVVGGRVEVVPVSTEAVTPTPAVALVETPTGEVVLAATATPQPTTAPTVEYTPTPTSTPTYTPVPTATPTPTNTPLPPTDTPVPVQPTPTSTPPTWTDDFDGTLGPGWSWTNDDSTHWSLTDVPGSLRIITQGDSLYSSLTSGFAPLNLLLREAPASNFEIVTKVSIHPVANFQQAVIIILQDDKNFVKLNRAYCGEGDPCIGSGIYFDVVTNGEYQWDTLVVKPFPDDIAYLKLRRAGTTFIGFYSADGVKWNESGRVTTLLTPTQIGITANNGGKDTPQIPADFDFFSVIER